MSFGVVVGRKRRKGILRDNLYSLGSAAEDWVEGHSAGSGSVAKNADHLRAEVSGNTASGGERTWVTSSSIDLTDFSTLSVDWENASSSEATNSRSFLVASTSQTGDRSVFDERLEKAGGGFARTKDSLDISALSENHFIRVHAADTTTLIGAPSDVLVYRVWLEE